MRSRRIRGEQPESRMFTPTRSYDEMLPFPPPSMDMESVFFLQSPMVHPFFWLC